MKAKNLGISYFKNGFVKILLKQSYHLSLINMFKIILIFI